MATPELDTKSPKALISYSWDDEAHKEWVRQLAIRLRKDGVDVMLDVWDCAPGDSIPAFMGSAIQGSDFVIVVCTPEFKKRLDQSRGGVGYEGDIMMGYVFAPEGKKSFIPVLRRGSWEGAAPTWLRGRLKIDLSKDPYPDSTYEDLLRTLLGAREKAPPVGSRRNFRDKKRPQADPVPKAVAQPMGSPAHSRMTKAEARQSFKEFFGEAAFNYPVYLIFPHRKLDPDLRGNPFLTSCNPSKFDPSQGHPGQMFEPEGVTAWLAFEDVRAATYITNTILEMTGRQVSAVHDKDVEPCKIATIVSFGLGFTDFTHEVVGLFEAPHFLFRVWPGPSQKRPHLIRYTDYFTVGNKDKDNPPNIPDGCDIGLVARIVPKHERGRPRRVWFVCAGRTAAGTAAAGYFLANKWSEMHRLYQEQHKEPTLDSLVAVIQHNENADSASGGPLIRCDGTADFLKDEKTKEKVIEWARVAGI